MKCVVWVTSQFEGFHHWPSAPAEIAFLRSIHRHIFHVKLSMRIEDYDRQIEFTQLKRALHTFCIDEFGWKPTTFSCEQMCVKLKDWTRSLEFAAKFGEQTFQEITVSEDGENGATLTHDN